MSAFNQYMLTQEGKVFADKYLDVTPLEEVNCPLCGSVSANPWYEMGAFRSLICQDCATRYVSPRYDDSQLDAHYSEALFTQSSDYEGVLHNMLDVAERQRKRKDMREEIDTVLTQLPDGGRILDIGCQTGIFLEALPDIYEKVGVERSEWAAEYCRKITKAEIYTGKIEDVQFPKTSFDLINISYVVEHLQDPVATLKQITPWLKEDGTLIISVPNFSSYCAILFREFYRLADPRQHIFLTTPESLSKLLGKFELSVDRTYYPYWQTPYCNARQLLRLVINSVCRIALPVLLKLGLVPKLQNVISPPFWGNIMTIVAKRKY